MIHKFQSPSEAIKALSEEREKTCVTVMIPLGHHSPGQQADHKHLDRAVNRAVDMMEHQKAEGAHSLKPLLLAMAKTVKFNRNDKGLGIYLTDHIAYYVTFPFPVHEYVAVTKSFRFKELYQLSQYSAGYFLLTISEKKSRLFTGQDAKLQEVSNKYFPFEFIEEYEYAEPSRSTSMAGHAHVKSFEKDKRAVQKRHFEDFLKKVDNHLGHYLDKGHDSFILCGTRSHTALFTNLTRHGDSLMGVHHGGYDWLDDAELAQMVWPSVEKFFDSETAALLEEFREKSGEGRCAQGLDQVWNALKEGRVDTLILDKGFDAAGYSPDNMPHLIMKQPPASSYSFHPSVANEMIDMAVGQGGKVVFVNPGLIPGGEELGAICRY